MWVEGQVDWGEEIVTKVKDNFRAGKKKVRNINRKKPKKHGEESTGL